MAAGGMPPSSSFKLIERILILSSQRLKGYASLHIFFLADGELMTHASAPFSINDRTYSLKIRPINDIWKHPSATSQGSLWIRSVNDSSSRGGFAIILVYISFINIHREALFKIRSVNGSQNNDSCLHLLVCPPSPYISRLMKEALLMPFALLYN